MKEILPDIPRIYTALAEWLACLVYILIMRKRIHGAKLITAVVGVLLVQISFLVLTDNLPVPFWIPTMIVAVLIMFATIYLICRITVKDAVYFCIRAFVAAEFIASLEWQIHVYIWKDPNLTSIYEMLMFLVIYCTLYLVMFFIEKQHLPEEGRMNIRPKELWSAVIIALSVFGISNLSFISFRTPFSGKYAMEIFNTRTLVDLGGIAILYAHHIQCCEIRVRQELEAIQNVLHNQFTQYQQSKESIEIINYKYHDLKNQIAVVRAEEDPVKRNTYLNMMEEDIKSYEAQNKTGNKVLDTVLTGKSMICIKNGITLTCVADGSLLNGMDVMDICTIFGNALDNAIECVLKIPDKEKRLIHVSVSSRNKLVMIRFENYFEGQLVDKDGMPKTSKEDTFYHGYGLKSIRYSAGKYGGAINVVHKNNWFELQVVVTMMNNNEK